MHTKSRYPELRNALTELQIGENIEVKISDDIKLSSISSTCKHLSKSLRRNFYAIQRKKLGVVCIRRLA